MLSHLGVTNRLLNVAFASGSQHFVRNLFVSDSFGFARPALRASGSNRRELTDSAPAALKIAFLNAGNWVERTLAALLQWRVDREFNLTEFHAGAQHAFHMVNDLLGSNEMQHLRPMLSPRLHEALSDMRKAYKQEGCIVSVEVDDIKEQNLMQVMIHTEQHMARFGVEASVSEPPAEDIASSQQDGEPMKTSAAQSERDSSAATGGTSQAGMAGINLEKLWLAVTVRYRGRIITKVTDGNGQVLSEDDDRRSQYWQFARGPLPLALPAQSVESPWFLLTMQ
ncbi:hypothetical protein WJX74_001037 [Apatococcus lobatus]|uniref:Tim44-like domain-containing protein n=1 Tax=Apatococcus lobatus TaxID=904363 RepID=A0AAW1QCL5_9CHLO